MNNIHPNLTNPLRKYLADILALLLAVTGFLASALVTQNTFEGIPHIEDEVAYVWQARLLAEGKLKISTPPNPKSLIVPFIVDYQGERFSKYPPGWPLVLSMGIQLGMRAWVNPLLAGLGVWLTYLLGKRHFSQLAGLLAAGLTASSPFFLMNSGSLLSHPLGLVLSAFFALAWLAAFGENKSAGVEINKVTARRQWVYTILSALMLGALILTRPMTALAVALPFAIHGIFLLLRGDKTARLRLITFAVLVIIFAGLFFLWQYSLTGDALLNPYTLWWPYDKVGFGPGHGRGDDGHTLSKAWLNLRTSINAGSSDLFGWRTYSWLFLPIGLWATRRNPKGLLLASVMLSIVLVYTTYWIGATLFGPRYYYEGLYSLTLISAAGIAWLAGWPCIPGEVFMRPSGKRMLRPLLVLFVLAILVGFNLIQYLPTRLAEMRGLYDIELADQIPFQAPEIEPLTPALVIVHTERWMEYGALLDLEDPEFTTPFIFAWSINPSIDASVANDFPGRSVYHYYPEQPFRFYLEPLPDS